jgi:hypothetical protein
VTVCQQGGQQSLSYIPGSSGQQDLHYMRLNNNQQPYG